MVSLAQVPDLTSKFDLSPIVWAALNRVASKEVKHDSIEQGSEHEVQLSLIGQVDGMPFRQSLSTTVTVGHDQEKATSATPDQPRLLAFILSKLNEATRKRLLEDIPSEFSTHGEQLPDVDEALIQDAKSMLGKLRNKKTIRARAAIRCDYELN